MRPSHRRSGLEYERMQTSDAFVTDRSVPGWPHYRRLWAFQRRAMRNSGPPRGRRSLRGRSQNWAGQTESTRQPWINCSALAFMPCPDDELRTLLLSAILTNYNQPPHGLEAIHMA